MKYKLILLSSCLLLIMSLSVNAETPEESLRKDMQENGYVPFEQAVSEYEKTYNKKILLPDFPFESNIKLGIVANDQLSIDLKNTNSKPPKSFSIFAKEANEQKLYFARETKSEKIELSDGNIAYFEDTSNSFTIAFRKDGIEYCYITRKDNGIKKEDFIKIAESLK